MRTHNRPSPGFTIVELLIVMVVIAILATISVVAYQGVQVRARDTLRTDGLAKIKRALELYKADKGFYPSATANPGDNGGWEASIDVSGSFMEYLQPYGFASGTPLDPTNNATYRFLYYRYAAGTNGCDPSRGAFYVLMATYENAANKPTGNTMTAECTTPAPVWDDTGGTHYAYHSYER